MWILKIGDWIKQLKGTIWVFPVKLTPTYWDNSSWDFLQLLLKLQCLALHWLSLGSYWQMTVVFHCIILYTGTATRLTNSAFPFVLKSAVPSTLKTWGNIYMVRPTPPHFFQAEADSPGCSWQSGILHKKYFKVLQLLIRHCTTATWWANA